MSSSHPHAFFPPLMLADDDVLQLNQWLAEFNLSDLYPVLLMNGVSLEQLTHCTDNDLQSLGITSFEMRHFILQKLQEQNAADDDTATGTDPDDENNDLPFRHYNLGPYNFPSLETLHELQLRHDLRQSRSSGGESPFDSIEYQIELSDLSSSPSSSSDGMSLDLLQSSILDNFRPLELALNDPQGEERIRECVPCFSPVQVPQDVVQPGFDELSRHVSADADALVPLSLAPSSTTCFPKSATVGSEHKRGSNHVPDDLWSRSSTDDIDAFFPLTVESSPWTTMLSYCDDAYTPEQLQSLASMTSSRYSVANLASAIPELITRGVLPPMLIAPLLGNKRPHSSSSESKIHPKSYAIRAGRWTDEEEVYAALLIEEFENGTLPLANGTMLRMFMGSVLNCDRMRVSKKFAGRGPKKSRTRSMGSHIYKRNEGKIQSITSLALEQKRRELVTTELAFLYKEFQLNGKENPAVPLYMGWHTYDPRTNEIIAYFGETRSQNGGRKK